MKSPAPSAVDFRHSVSRLVVIALALFASESAPARQIMSADELDSYVQGYYLHPQPERIGDAIEALGPSGFIQKNAWGFASFFGEVFATHPDHLPGWKKLIARQDKSTRDFLQHSLELGKSGGTLALTGHTSGLNDMFWGAFYATGKPDFVLRLIDELRYFDERKDQDLFLAGATAKWSLLSNAGAHPLVRKTLEAARAGADTRTREVIETMLKQNAEDVRREMGDIIARQRAAGIWR